MAVKAGTKEAEGCWGTPRYKAPEQWEGKACLQSDVYALGLIAFELLTGRNLIGCMIDDREYRKVYEDKKANWMNENKERYNNDDMLKEQWEIHDHYRCLHERASEWLKKRASKWLGKGARDAFLPAILLALKPNPQERIQSSNELAQELRAGLQEAREREGQMHCIRRVFLGAKIRSQEIAWGG